MLALQCVNQPVDNQKGTRGLFACMCVCAFVDIRIVVSMEL